jgi:hypothetical protein
VEEFLQALTAQLDRAQDALALKVSGTNRPLTWALKDLKLDLRVFVEVNDGGRVLLRSAGPNEEGASTLHLDLTTVTRPMVEENSWSYGEDEDLRSLDDLQPTSKLDDDARRKLDWLGVRTVGQLRQLDPQAVQAVVGIPTMRLQAALAAAARPTVTGHQVLEGPDGRTLVRILGANLTDGVTPEVRLGGHPVEILESSPRQILVRPPQNERQGQVEVFTQGRRVTGFFNLGEPELPGSPVSNGQVDQERAASNGHGGGKGDTQSGARS